uniref:BHLH domain-containing protein n=1 Tax=Ascaris lumbricoides TaxID=6252 RepID=A0A0M3ITP9_ASCLU
LCSFIIAVESGGQSTAWDDPNWGKEAIKDNPHSKEARRAELAARNEARRKELAAKRAAKASAALRPLINECILPLLESSFLFVGYFYLHLHYVGYFSVF